MLREMRNAFTSKSNLNPTFKVQRKDEHTFKPSICEGTKLRTERKGSFIKTESEMMTKIQNLI